MKSLCNFHPWHSKSTLLPRKKYRPEISSCPWDIWVFDPLYQEFIVLVGLVQLCSLCFFLWARCKCELSSTFALFIKASAFDRFWHKNIPAILKQNADQEDKGTQLGNSWRCTKGHRCIWKRHNLRFNKTPNVSSPLRSCAVIRQRGVVHQAESHVFRHL